MNQDVSIPASNSISSNALNSDESATDKKPAQRLAKKYYFNDPDMYLFFMAALGWGPSGGLDIGQAFYIASQIIDGDADSWVKSFGEYADMLNQQADTWRLRGWQREAGEVRLKAFAAYRSAWQFALPGENTFKAMYSNHQKAFTTAMSELDLPETFFNVPYKTKQLPGIFLRNPIKDAPVVLIIGGADTCFEDLFLTLGRNLFVRGFSVALIDLPGQGATAMEGLHWEADAEKSIATVTDTLIDHFSAMPGRIALIGLSLGGYFVTRAAGYDNRFATVIASTPFPSPAEMFALSLKAAMNNTSETPTEAAKRSRRVTLWKVGAKTPQDFIELTKDMVADPTRVTVPFLSVLGGGDSGIFAAQANQWHQQIRSTRKDLILLDAASGADGHVQVNNRLRLTQECSGWMREIFKS